MKTKQQLIEQLKNDPNYSWTKNYSEDYFQDIKIIGAKVYIKDKLDRESWYNHGQMHSIDQFGTKAKNGDPIKYLNDECYGDCCLGPKQFEIDKKDRLVKELTKLKEEYYKDNRYNWFNINQVIDFYRKDNYLWFELESGSQAWYYNGQLHREDGPAYITIDGVESYYLKGEILDKEDWEQKIKLSKKEKSTMETKDLDECLALLNKAVGYAMLYEDILYYKSKISQISFDKDKNELYLEYKNGQKHWYKDGKHHRENGPAIIYANGKEKYYTHGKLDVKAKTVEPNIKTNSTLNQQQQDWIKKLKQDPVWKNHHNWINITDIDYNEEKNELYVLEDGSHWWSKDGKFHREDGPAWISPDGTEEYWLDAIIYSKDKFNEKIFQTRLQKLKESWEKNWIYLDWSFIADFHYENNILVVKYKNNDQFWIMNGELHCENGPAVTFASKSVEYYLYGIHYYTKEAYERDLDAIKLKNELLLKQEWRGTTQEQHLREAKYVYKHGDRLGGYRIVSSKEDIFINQNGQYHREHGPAYQGKWYLNGKEYTKEKFDLELKINILKNDPTTQKSLIKWDFDIISHIDILGSSEYYIEWNNKEHCKGYYKNGKQHCLTGPAFIADNRQDKYCIDGEEYTKKNFDKEVLIRKLKAIPNSRWSNFYWPNVKSITAEDSGFTIIENNNDIIKFNNKGERHCETGPAAKYNDRREEYWLDGNAFSKENFEKEIQTREAVKYIKNNISAFSKIFDINNVIDAVKTDNKLYVNTGTSNLWFENYILHREDGPAIFQPNNKVEGYYLNGKKYTLEEYNDQINFLKIKKEIDADPKWKSFFNWNVIKKVEKINDCVKIETTYNSQEWYQDRRLHCEDGPAIITPSEQRYYLKGNFVANKYKWETEKLRIKIKDIHPLIKINDNDEITWDEQNDIIILKNKNKTIQYQYGKFHNDSGPAISGAEEKYYVYGTEYSKEDFEKRQLIIKEFQEKCPIWSKTYVDHNYIKLINKENDQFCIQDSAKDIRWIKDDQIHREDGPAVEWINGDQEYWLNGKRYFYKEEYDQELKHRQVPTELKQASNIIVATQAKNIFNATTEHLLKDSALDPLLNSKPTKEILHYALGTYAQDKIPTLQHVLKEVRVCSLSNLQSLLLEAILPSLKEIPLEQVLETVNLDQKVA